MATFIVSLTTDAFCTSTECVSSIGALSFGWLGLVVGSSNFSWLANIALAASWFTLRKNLKQTKILAASGILLAAWPLFTLELAVDEAGSPRQIHSFKAGYLLWILSIVIVLIGAILKEKQEKAAATNP